jgi:hypothetical protein
LSAALPLDTHQVTAAERRELIEKRAAAYAHRYATTPAVASLATTR